MQTAKLIFVSNDNHNKYYDMVSDGATINIKFGRVGVTEQTTQYPHSKWDSLLKSKIKKGYKEVTHLYVEPSKSNKVSFLDISDQYISKLISKLGDYTKIQVSNNYLVTSDTVTQKQVDEAQTVLNSISSVKNNKQLNDLLLEVFSIIPRKMKHVQDHLYDVNQRLRHDVVEQVIAKEQELLDSMSQQVKQSALVLDNTNDKLTLLDAMGIEIFNVSPDAERNIKSKLRSLSEKYIKAYEVTNKKTQKRFDNFIGNATNKTTDTFFHGSRNENWLPILQTGLVLRPTNSVITGKMFGYGTYYADKATKSWGYTSANGSYWANGASNEAYLALFDVHLGNSLKVTGDEHWVGSLNEKKLKGYGNYDSVFAQAGPKLRNNEFIVYTEDQSTIKYLIQMKG